MRISNPSRYGLPLVAALVLTAALSLWLVRRNHSQAPSAEQVQQVRALLKKSVEADNTLTYSATSTVTAMYGAHTMKAKARLVRAPGKLSITYMNGDSKGLHSGYNEKWFWRQANDSSPLKAYAAVEYPPHKMAEERFKLTIQNYEGRILGSKTLNGRLAQIVELQPRNPVDGARGPMKRLWIDQDNGLTLRVDSFNYQAQPVMTSELSRVNLNPDTKDAFVPPVRMHDAAAVTPWMAMEMGNQIQKVAQKTGINPPTPRYRPPGFAFDSVGVHHCTDMGTKVVAALTRYSDGINVLTIFAMRPGVKLPGTEDKATGASGKAKILNRQSCDFGMGTMVMRDLPEGRLVAVADLPPKTMDRVIDSTTISFATPGKAANGNRKP